MRVRLAHEGKSENLASITPEEYKRVGWEDLECPRAETPLLFRVHGALLMQAETTDLKIANEIYIALKHLGAEPMLLAIIGSWGDTLSDEEVLSALQDWNNKTVHSPDA
jgi:hypothetical protein